MRHTHIYQCFTLPRVGTIQVPWSQTHAFIGIRILRAVRCDAASLHNCTSSIKPLLKEEASINAPINIQPKKILVFMNGEKNGREGAITMSYSVPSSNLFGSCEILGNKSVFVIPQIWNPETLIWAYGAPSAWAMQGRLCMNVNHDFFSRNVERWATEGTFLPVSDKQDINRDVLCCST